MKKGLLFVASALVLGGLASCGCSPDKSPDLSTVKATYKAEYILDVDSTKKGELAFEREVSDVVTIEADFTPGKLYLYGKRVGTEYEETPKTTYEVLVYKDGDTYKFLNSQMGDAVSLDSEEAAKTKINEYLRKVSFRSGGWIDSTTFIYPETTNEYEHHHFLLDSTTIPREDMNEEPTITTTEDGKQAKMDMSYVGYQTDAGTSELHNEPIAASVEVDMDNKSRVTSFKVDYKDAWMDMPIGTPAPVLTLKGSRSFEAKYDEEITRIATIDHEAVKGEMLIKPSYKNGTVKVYGSENGKEMPRKELKNGDKVEVDSWITVEATPNAGGSVVSVLNNVNAVSEVEGKYIFLAEAGINEIKVVFGGGVAEKGKVLFAEGTKPDEIYNEWKLVEFEFTGKVGEIIDVAGYEIELKGATWFGIATLKEGGYKNGKTEADYNFSAVTPSGTTEPGFSIPDPDQSVPYTYMCWQLKTAGDYTVSITPKEVGPVGPDETTKATIKVAPAYIGVAPEIRDCPKETFGPAVAQGKLVTAGDYKMDTDRQLSIFVGKGKNSENTTVTVGDAELIGGKDQYGWFSFNILEAKDYVVTIELKDKTDLSLTDAIIEILPNDELFSVAKLQYFDGNPDQTGGLKDLDGTSIEAKAGRQLSIALTLVEGVDTPEMYVNGAKGKYMEMFGAYLCKIEVAGLYKVEFKAATPVDPEPEVTTKATIKTSAVYEGFPDVRVVNAPKMSFGIEAIEAGTPLTLGTDYLCEVDTQISIYVGSTYTESNVTVTCGEATLIGQKAFNNWFSFDILEAKEYVITIVAK